MMLKLNNTQNEIWYVVIAPIHGFKNSKNLKKENK